MPTVHALLEKIRGRSILVVGDLMLDHFVIGRVDRISPEAPVPVVQFEHDEFRLGGAANVASNVMAMGGRVELAGVVGDDGEADRLLADLSRRQIGRGGIVKDQARCTTRKVRIVTTRNQQVARIDYERDGEIEGETERAIVRHIQELGASADAIVISDYLKGVVSRGVAQAAAALAGRRRIPLLVDPKVPHVDYYAGGTIVTPNHHEAEAVTHMRIRSSGDARDAARRFRDRVRCDAVLITRGEHGMWLLAPEGEAELPAEAREVADVTGAGDTVIAALALGLAAGAATADAARLANRAAGIVVGKFGPAAVTIEELQGR
jgi:D-beta-D-heptose 7-phosphate kinase/D-beta-D-heptose 1-phosphate adenosyltransferase